MDISRKNTFIILVIILALSFTINILTFKNGHDWGGDFAAYIIQAKSLVDGTPDQLDTFERYLLENSTFYVGALSGPLGVPLLLSPVYYFFGLNIYAMKVMIFSFFILSLFVVFLLFQEKLNNLQNLLLVSIFAFNTWFFNFKDNVLSDIPFMFFSLFSLLLIQRFIISKKIWINEPVSYSLIGILIFLSCNIRSAGFVLLPTLLVVQYIESRSYVKNKALFLLKRFNYLPHIIFLVSTLALKVSFKDILPEGAFSGYFHVLLNKSVSKMIPDIIYLVLLPSRFFPFLFLKMNAYGFDYNKFSLLLYAMILLVVIFAMIKNIKKDYMYFFYILFTIAITLSFSQRQGFRLIIPIIPFFLYFLFIGLSRISLSFALSDRHNLNVRADSIFGFAMIIVSLLYFSQASYQNILFNKAGQVIEGPYLADSVELFNYIKTNTDKNDGVIFYKPRVLTLYTDRKALALRRDFTIDDLLKTPANYYVHMKQSKLKNVSIQDLRDNFDCVFENGTFMLFRLKNKSVYNSAFHTAKYSKEQ